MTFELVRHFNKQANSIAPQGSVVRTIHNYPRDACITSLLFMLNPTHKSPPTAYSKLLAKIIVVSDFSVSDMA